MASAGEHRREDRHQHLADTRDEIRRAFADFLALPTEIIASFLLLAAGSYALDRAAVGWLAPARGALQALVFANVDTTATLLGTVAGGLITVTSITFSLLLLAVQQAAGSLTFQVIDQFLRRRLNQFAFGFFVGLAIYALLVLATANPPFNPVFGATLAFALTGVALYLLLLLLYTTLNQTRPAEIVAAIHHHTLAARERQLSLIRGTRRAPCLDGAARMVVRAPASGYVIGIDVGAIGAAAGRTGQEAEVVLRVSIGSFVAFDDPMAEVAAPATADAAAVAKATRAAVHLARQRNLHIDPAYGIEQLATIAWTSISTAKSNPAPGLLVIRSLRDLLARWSREETEARKTAEAAEAARETRGPRESGTSQAPPPVAPVVYTDTTLAQLMDAFESLAVVSSESMQYQNFAEVARTFAVTLDRLPPDLQVRANDLIRRVLSGLGDHVLTADLDAALSDLARTLAACGRADTAAAVRAAQGKLAESIGKLGSRATRVPAAG